jgi:hypothetical protein
MRYISILLLFAFFFAACAQDLPDYDLYENMRQYIEQKFNENGLVLRADMPDIFTSEYIIDLSGMVRIAFGSPELEVHLSSYESNAVAVASISMFEVPPNSTDFTDFACSIRPSANLRAPFIHADALKASPGMPGSCEIHFMNVNRDPTDSEEFLGDQGEKNNDSERVQTRENIQNI